jgi:mRNA interferase HigB
MRVIAQSTLRNHWQQPDRRDSEQPLKAWYQAVKRASWTTPNDVKAAYRNASFLADSRVCFNIAGNKYRLVVHIKYSLRIVLIKFIATHKEYDKIDAETI